MNRDDRSDRTDKPTSGGADTELFRAEVADVRPLATRRVSPSRPRPRPVPYQSISDARAVIDELLNGDDGVDLAQTGDEEYYVRPGVQRSVLRRLRRGDFVIQAELDLHGLTVDAARESLRLFLRRIRIERLRCVRIIHGKGLSSPNREPVLKYKVARWLRQCDDVLATSVAQPRDGGTGALYVLLRSRRPG
jgi:DNA-nicking Smr family endonuclease